MGALSLTRRGWTLHEMLISLAVTGGIFVLASTAALGHLRFFRGTGEVVALRSQLGHATNVAANVLRGVESTGDILVAQDSAAEVHASYGAAFACSTDTGAVVMPAATDHQGAVSAFSDTPQRGDIAHMLVEDDTSATWIRLRVTASPVSGGGCPGFPSVAATWRVTFQEGVVVSAGAALRFARRIRISAYRASDDRWYLGMREWNGATDRLNTIQPVAGPLRPVSADPATTGFRLTWSDSTGATLSPPVDPSSVATITVMARGESTRPVRVPGLWSPVAPLHRDSLATALTLRNR